MRYLYIELENYIGIYSGLLLNKIEIDLRKCTHRLLVIKGMNGSGKTTLFNAISVLPDDNNQFLPGKPARKRVDIYDDFTNTEYKILFVHGIKKNGERETTKGYISKLMPGQGYVEMNPSGNISSYKDYIYEEFQLDANFLALSQLSVEDRGLVEKKPSERKKIVTSIINTLEAYNAMYKIVSKKSHLYKSMINSINLKITGLGDPQLLSSALESTNASIDKLQMDRESIVQKMNDAKSMIKILDPTGDIRLEYDTIYNKLRDVTDNIIKTNSVINSYGLDITRESISDIYNKNNDDIKLLENKISNIQTTINMLLAKQDEDSLALKAKIAKLNNLSDDKSEEYYISALNELQGDIDHEIEALRSMGITDYSISKDEYIIGLNILNDIRNGILALQEKYTLTMITDAIDNYIPYNTYPDYIGICNQLDSAISNVEATELEMKSLLDKQSIIAVLKDRPVDCKIDKCKFIADAVRYNKEDISGQIRHKQAELDNAYAMKTKLKEDSEYSKLLIECINLVKSFLNQTKNYASLLNKLPNGNKYTNQEYILDRLKSSDSFKDIEDLYSYIDSANIIENYKRDTAIYEKYKDEYSVFMSKESILQEIRDDINRINDSLRLVQDQLENNRDGLVTSNKTLEKAMLLETKLSTIIGLYGKLTELESVRDDLVKQSSNLEDNMKEIKESVDIITTGQEYIKDIDYKIQPLLKKRDDLIHSMKKLDEYLEEIKLYSENYEKIECIKYYTSPSTGIQTLFMDLYMNKILADANELLQLVFNGEFALQQFVINDSEFRIPCVGRGIVHNDISFMSTSQKCMISMILSFSLLRQSSTRYNILKIDEIDGGLDTRNRLNLTILLESLMNVIQSQQTIVISHNNELDMTQADVIVLRDDDNEFTAGNIIFKY